MVVLFENKILDATLSAINANGSYPVSNLQSPYIRKVFESLGLTDTVTITFDTVQQLDTIFWGYTNMSEMEIRFYDESDALLEKIYFSGGNVGHYYGYPTEEYYGYDDEYYGYFDRTGEKIYDPESWYLSHTLDVKKIEIELTATDNPVFLGGFACGLKENIGNPRATWSETHDDRSIVSESEAGQVLQLYNRPQRQYAWTIGGLSRAEMNEIQERYRLYGRGVHLWVDPFENNHDFIAPLYCTLENSITAKKNGYNYSFEFEIKEAR